MSYEYEKALGTSRDISAEAETTVGAPSTPWYLQPWFMLTALAGGALYLSRDKLRGMVRNPTTDYYTWHGKLARLWRDAAGYSLASSEPREDTLRALHAEGLTPKLALEVLGASIFPEMLFGKYAPYNPDGKRIGERFYLFFLDHGYKKLRGSAGPYTRANVEETAIRRSIAHPGEPVFVFDPKTGWLLMKYVDGKRTLFADSFRDSWKVPQDWIGRITGKRNPSEGLGHGWVVVVKAPDGTHEIGRAETKDEANRIASDWMGRTVDLWGSMEQRVGDYGSVLSRGKQIGYLGWDYVFETGMLDEPVKVELGYEPDEWIPGWYDNEMIPVDKAIVAVLQSRGVEPYSHDNKVYAADARAAADAVAEMGRTGAAAAKVLRQAAKAGKFPDPYEM
jgi:hypothetical protein